jgi:soluble lytic murein transglycosylase-like protein
MSFRIAAQLVVLATSLAATDLAAADRAAAASSPPDHRITTGDGGVAAPASLDPWHESLTTRLDGSITTLRAQRDQEETGLLAVTWGTTDRADLDRTFASSRADPEEQNRFPLLAGILSEYGLPPSLIGVVAVESGFNPLALSPKGARGLWQLMPATARRYGLIVGPQLDERTDPTKSTQAAAAYIRDLLAQFQDWPLALAAYNAGEDRVARAMKRTGARDFWALRRNLALPDETLRYVPAVLARLDGPLGSSQPSADFPLAQDAVARGTVLHATMAP